MNKPKLVPDAVLPHTLHARELDRIDQALWMIKGATSVLDELGSHIVQLSENKDWIRDRLYWCTCIIDHYVERADQASTAAHQIGSSMAAAQ